MNFPDCPDKRADCRFVDHGGIGDHDVFANRL